MKARSIASCALLLFAAACDEAALQPGMGGVIRELPDEVVALAAPNQDLKSVRLVSEDGCYWYRHKGPVETTMLPLRSTDGNPICAQVVPEAAGEADASG